MQLAKNAIDVGLFTNNLEPMLNFWQQRVGLPFNELLPVGGGIRQHRHAIGLTVFKLNHARDPLPPAEPGGIQKLTVLLPGADTERNLTDPDGNLVEVVPIGDGDQPRVRIHLQANDADRASSFYQTALGMRESGDVLVCGESELAITGGGSISDPAQRGEGYRYMTVQVHDVVAAHAEVLEAGGQEGMAPKRLGDVAYISFVRDPDGNWIELSQRKSIVGHLD